MAVAHCMNNGLPGKFMLQGDKLYSAKEMLNMVERSANKNSLATGNSALHSITSLLDDFFTGNTHDGNFGDMMNHYANSGVQADIPCFWKETGLKSESISVAEFYKTNPVNPDQPQYNWKFHLD